MVKDFLVVKQKIKQLCQKFVVVGDFPLFYPFLGNRTRFLVNINFLTDSFIIRKIFNRLRRASDILPLVPYFK